MSDMKDTGRIRMLQHNLRRLTKMLDKSSFDVIPEFEIPEDVIVDERDPFSPDFVDPDVQNETRAQKKGRAAIVCWDLSHNPAGRAIVLYDLLARDWDVELIGPVWSQFGGKVWTPIAKSNRKIRSFNCESLTDFLPAAQAFAETNPYDLVVVSKPRAPSLALGAMLKKFHGSPMVLDVDDLELSFADSQDPVTEAEIKKNLTEAFEIPFESLSTRYCDKLIGEADSVTVSNIALRGRYGGHIVRHARNENIFDPSLYDRDETRQKLGLKKNDFALMFVGTPRPHKGIYDIAEALHEMNDKRFVLNIVGDINYPGMQARLEELSNARINFYPNCDFRSLPAYMAAADAIPLMQDTENEIAQWQIPAKISDGMAFGLPIITTEVPPIFDLEQQNLVTVIHKDYFAETLLDLYEARKEKTHSKTQARIRAGFEDELGFRVNRQRLQNAIVRASKADPQLPRAFETLLEHMRAAFLKLERKTKIKPSPALKGKPDLVMFWKQNDSGIYGRRSDMIMKHLLEANRFGRILQFDSPINLEDLSKMVERADGPLHPAALTVTQAYRNKLGLNDTKRHFLRTFIWSDTFRNSEIIEGTSMNVYPTYVEEQMSLLKFDPENTIAWVCPVVQDFPRIIKQIPFQHIVCDIIDDQRAFDLSQTERRLVEENYEAILPVSDVVMTNCQPNVDSFAPLTKTIHFVPNGTEIPPDDLPMPEALQDIPRPIAGYVGHLQDRIDWDLLDEAAHHIPDVSFVIAGGGALQENIDRLNQRPNVHFVGVVPYEKVKAYIQHFDVCIVPHKGSDLTKRMNPLKVYNYFAAKKPIVTTEVANIDGSMNPYIRFAKNAGELAVYIKDCLAEPQITDERYMEVLDEITWQSRINYIGSILDENLKTKKKTPAKKTPAKKTTAKKTTAKKKTAKKKSSAKKPTKSKPKGQ